MKNIAIVEDEDAAAAVLTSYIEKYSATTGQSFNVVRFKSGREFIADYKQVYAVVFMDIQMPGLNGFDTAVALRKLDKTVSLVFITSLVQFAQKGYEVDAVSFLVKPVSYFDFSLKFGKALDIYVMNEERVLIVKYRGGMCRISTDKLMYVEIISHRLYYHLIDDVIEVTGVLSQVEKELGEYGFLRCNKCYLVNPKFVIGVKGSDVTVGNTVLQISRPRRATFLAELANRYAGSGDKK
ncbi:MAG: LytTR family DNA-binding domain-containing protein [Clostridiales bacterium]|nr:LytTR family DNA-binding domain-containing protein [Clostridiales bacterium]